MLNIRPVFMDAVISIAEAGDLLGANPLAATVFLMQQDLINQYQYALEHYLTVELTAPFLQNSSLGTPVQKWAKFTNEDFANLSFHVHNLIRYTARLMCETLSLQRQGARDFARSKDASSKYISPLVQMRHPGADIGLQVEESNRIQVRSLELGGLHAQAEESGVSYRWETDSERRALLLKLKSAGEDEVASSLQAHAEYSAICERFYQARRIIEPFDRLHPSHCI